MTTNPASTHTMRVSRREAGLSTGAGAIAVNTKQGVRSAQNRCLCHAYPPHENRPKNTPPTAASAAAAIGAATRSARVIPRPSNDLAVQRREPERKRGSRPLQRRVGRRPVPRTESFQEKVDPDPRELEEDHRRCERESQPQGPRLHEEHYKQWDRCAQSTR